MIINSPINEKNIINPITNIKVLENKIKHINEEENDHHEETQNTTSPKEKKHRNRKTYPPSNELLDQLNHYIHEQRTLNRKMTILSHDIQRSIKNECKKMNKKEKNPTNKKPRGFALPSPISHEMVEYLLNIAKITSIDRKISDQSTIPVKIEKGCLIARNELTSALCNHFKNSHMRKNESDKRDIHLDWETANLFQINIKDFTEYGGRVSKNGEPIITYFALQKYLPRHCGKLVNNH
jgi:hypothetical protein